EPLHIPYMGVPVDFLRLQEQRSSAEVDDSRALAFREPVAGGFTERLYLRQFHGFYILNPPLRTKVIQVPQPQQVDAPTFRACAVLQLIMQDVEHLPSHPLRGISGKVPDMLVFPCGISEHGRNLWVWMVWQVEDSILIPRPCALSILQDVELLAQRMLFELVKGQQ